MSLCVFNPPFLTWSYPPDPDNHLFRVLYNPSYCSPFTSVSSLHHPDMDSFHEPRRVSEPIKLEDLTAEVLARTAEYHAKGIPLSGRIIHVCHYLPVAATLHASSRPAILSPPPTPPQQAANIPLSSPDGAAPPASDHTPEGGALGPRWSLSARQGHAAMISGIRSLSVTHEQFIIGWVGDIESPNANSGTSPRAKPKPVPPLHDIIRVFFVPSRALAYSHPNVP